MAELEPDLVHYVPDEVCVLTRSAQGSDPREIYEQVRAALNSALRQVLDQSPAQGWHGDDALMRDLSPTELRGRFGGGSDLLQPLERPGIGPGASVGSGMQPPWYHLPGVDDNDNTHHFYYALGTDRVDFHPAQLDERQRRLACVRELVNLLNHPPTGVSTAVDERWSIVASAPNWLTVAAQFACGSPASLPQLEPRTGRWRFRFDADLEAAMLAAPHADPAEVVVAILDTAPDSAEVPTHGNEYLAEVLRALRIHSAPASGVALHSDYFSAPPGVAHYWDTVKPWWLPTFRVAPRGAQRQPGTAAVGLQDHGLFVAGIIHDVAPDAELHLIRVLNDVGVGDALALGHVLSTLPSALGSGGRRRLIVNLSLGATVPVPPRRHWARWLPITHATHAKPDLAAQHLLDDAHSSLLSIVNWLRRQGVLVVAAAGNDALRHGSHTDTPPPPRYPARYQEVFAVAASGSGGAPASYSNRADVRPLGNGITSFGGDIDRDGNGIVGIYSANTFPGDESNVTGWAKWAGTSFATPVIAGVAARIWTHAGDHNPTEIMDRVLGFAKPPPSGPVPDADPDGPLDAPVLAAWQEHLPPSDGVTREQE